MENFPPSTVAMKDAPLRLLWDLRVKLDLEILHRIWPALAVLAMMLIITLWFKDEQ